MTDLAVYPIAKQLLDCLVGELAATRAGAPCVATVHPGDMTPAYGWCDCDAGEGMAWTRVAQIYPTTSFPTPLLQPTQSTTAMQFVAAIELGVDRCYWNTDDNSMPPPAVLDSLARDAIDDAAAMQRAVWCCFGGTAIVGSWTPRGPAGGIHGGTLPITVLVDGWCGCGPIDTALDEITPPLDGDPRFPPSP